MTNTNDITASLGTLYHPTSALVFYETKEMHTRLYVEHFDIDKNGSPINAHPLSEREAKVLAKALQTEKDKDKAFLKPDGILATNILHINPNKDKGSVLWYTKAQKRQLYFVRGLEIPNGIAEVPPMIWLANKNSLWVFALGSNRRPTEKTSLYYAPFFNIYEDGKVCMGSVNINIANAASVEDFVGTWESYFFKSYFSHLMNGYNPVKGNCVSLWKELVVTGKPFPKNVLKKNNKTLKNILR